MSMTSTRGEHILTLERANELLRYDPRTGKIYWRVRPANNVHVGDEAGTLKRGHTNTYRYVEIDGKTYYAHRLAWLLHFGVWPKDQIDHIDGDGLNNQVENLRDVSRQENMKNTRMYSHNTSGATGVCWHKRAGKWQAKIMVDRKYKFLGYFTDREEAAATYRKAADELGFTERHGTEKFA